MADAKKTDNSHLNAKLALRAHFLERYPMKGGFTQSMGNNPG